MFFPERPHHVPQQSCELFGVDSELTFNFIPPPQQEGGCCVCVYTLSHVQLFYGPMDYYPPGSSVLEISQARMLNQIAIRFSRVSSRPRDWTHISCIGRWILYLWATWGTLFKKVLNINWVYILLKCYSEKIVITKYKVLHKKSRIVCFLKRKYINFLKLSFVRYILSWISRIVLRAVGAESSYVLPWNKIYCGFLKSTCPFSSSVAYGEEGRFTFS